MAQFDRSAPRVRLLIATLTLGLALASSGLVAAQNQSGQYEVQPGDTLYSIAVAAGMSVDALVALNGLDDPDVLYAGQVLKLGDAAPLSPPTTIPIIAAATPAPSISYTVQPGDTLYSIGRRNGVAVDALLKANGMTDPDLLLAGQQIVIPKDWTAAAAPRPDDPPITMAAARPTARPSVSMPLAATVAAPTSRPSPTGQRAGTPVPTPASNALVTPRPSPRPPEMGKWLGSPNYWSGRPAGPPIAIVLHTAAGTLPGMDNWFANTDSQSSAHYGVGLGGDVHQYVKLEDRSWCNGSLEADNLWPISGSIQPNELTVNIETEDLGDSHVPVTDAEYEATVRVGRAILARYPQIKYLITHRALNPTTRANDPGPRWLDSGRFNALAQELKLIPIP